MWQLVEPIHAITYLAPEAQDTFEQVGLRGFWRGCFAGRAALMSAVGPGVGTACFFHPAFVERALPSVWSMASPEAAHTARLWGGGKTMRQIFAVEEEFGDGFETSATQVARMLQEALAGIELGGRPMLAANAALAWPPQPQLAPGTLPPS